MRFLFLPIQVMILLYATNVSAQGLPANPWLTKREVINNTVTHISRDNITAQAVDNNINIQDDNIDYNTQELKDTILNIKEKLQQGENQTNAASDNKEVNAIDAFNAFNTLSKYVGQNNQSDNAKVNNNHNSASFGDIKRKMQKMMNNNGNTSSSASTSQSNEITREFDKAKNKYHHYKSQVTSNYNN